jgi:pimeloyl-ACP methyl ester carboxylesterase
MWRPQFEGLPEFHCLAPDLPEHGQSAHIAPFSMGDTVARLSGLIRRSTPQGRAHLVGLSFGGVVAQAMMVQAPDVVDHVILSGTATRFGGPLMAALKLQMVLSDPLLRLLSPSQLGWLLAVQFGIPRAFRSILGEDIKRVPPVAMARFVLATYADITTPARASRPVLVAVGKKETPVAKWMAKRLRQSIVGARGVMVPGGGHVWNLQHPKLFNDVVRAWVRDEPLPAGLLAL